jgi:hypothetical protein
MKLLLFVVLLCTLLVTSCIKELREPVLEIQPAGTEKILAASLPASYTIADTMIIDGYALRYNIKNIGDSLEVFINSKKLVKNARFNVYTSTGTIADYVFADSIIPQKILNTEPYKNGYGYKYKVTFRFSKVLVSGVYTISKNIFFVVKNAAQSGQVAFLLHTNTHMAYNTTGGASLYTTGVTAVSSQRPWRQDRFGAEIIKWNGTPYAFDWYTDIDMDNYASIAPYKLLVIVGHSEYWSHEARANLDRFIAEGKNVLILSGNTLWWQVRYNADKSQVICYKTLNDPEATGIYRTTNFHLLTGQSGVNTIGANFVYGGYGDQVDNGWDGFKILEPKNPLFAGTNLAYKDIVSCKPHELDGAPTRFVAGKQHPVINMELMPFYKAQLLAYDLGSRNNAQTVGTFIVIQKTATSGVVVNVGNTDWCSERGMGGPHGAILKQITKNAIYLMYTSSNVFRP